MASHDEPATEIPDDELYSMFTRSEKWYIVFLISFAGWFSTLSSFIYYPAISQIAHNLNTTVSQINLTVASYMAVSTVAPAFVGDAADVLGRRPLYLIVIAIYLAANVALANARSFAQLLGLRMLQSAGVAGIYVNKAGFS
jgi:MFS family permease